MLEKRFPADTYAQPNYLLRNSAGKRFVDVSNSVGMRKVENRVGRGTAFADFDNDGDVDILVINKNDIPTFLLNSGGNRRNWLAIRTQGVASNRDGIGAKIVVAAGGEQRVFEVRGSDSYLSSNDLRVHVGLGDTTSADIGIRWPSGREDRHDAVAAGKFYLAVEGQALRVEPLPPLE